MIVIGPEYISQFVPPFALQGDGQWQRAQGLCSPWCPWVIAR